MLDLQSAEFEVVDCKHCGQKNRVKSAIRVSAICDKCGAALVANPPSTSPELADSLLRRYRAEFERGPCWAFPLPPPVPFVGRSYDDSKVRIAVYASAENLSIYERDVPLPSFCHGALAWNRHRLAFEGGSSGFFPRVHIAPIENGSLLCAALYFLQQYIGGPLPGSPVELLEGLAVANVAKFSILTNGGPNKDYAHNAALLDASVPFFRADMQILRPDVLIIPRTMFNHRTIRAAVDAGAPAALVLPLPQFNATVLNIQLKGHAARSAVLQRELRSTLLGRWTEELRGYRSGYPYRYYVEIDDVLKASKHPWFTEDSSLGDV